MMRLVRLGILCPSDIAYRRFLPALSKLRERFVYVGVAGASASEWAGSAPPSSETLQARKSKLDAFVESYGGKVFSGYNEMLSCGEIDAVYIPLPPALHAFWGKQALLAGKHVLLEKPFTTSVEDTRELLRLAKKQELAVHENYMFIYHSQLQKIKELLAQGAVGTPRLYRMCFGFPRRDAKDFRYNKELGGGALLDCGGYPLRMCLELLGRSSRVVCSKLNYQSEYEVDISGSVTVENDAGVVAQIAFGMDNEYRCELDIWGSTGSLCAPRVFTSGADVESIIILRQAGAETRFCLPCFDQFEQSIIRFYQAICESTCRSTSYIDIACQAELVNRIQEMEQ